MTEEIWLCRIETAKKMRVTPETLAVWASTKRHDLPYIKIGRKVYYRLSDINNLIKSRTIRIVNQ